MNAKIIYKHGRQSYGLSIFEPQNALLLADFLTDDVGGRANRFVKDFEDAKDHCGAMNATQYTKLDGKVFITPEWIIDEDESISNGNYFFIQATTLAQLLRQWEIVHKQRPPYIKIIITDNHVSVTGSDTFPDLSENPIH